MKQSIFDWNNIQMPEDCEFKISPSSISKFFEYPVNWYKENVLKEESDFKGNTATVLGTVCHKIYECFAKNEPIDREFINEELNKLDNPAVDIDDVKANYPSVAGIVINEYLKNNLPTKVEISVVGKIADNIYVGGTCDNLTGTVVVDYKHVATKPNENQIPWNYKVQLMAYAYALRSMGHYVDTIRIVYGVKPTKTIGARCIIVTEQITDHDWIAITDTLKLIAESIIKVKEDPSLTHLIFKSMNLKV